MAANRETVKAGVRVEGINETLKAFKGLDKQASVEAKQKAQEIADKVGGHIRNAANGFPDRRYALLAQSVKAGRDRTPQVKIGGAASPKASGGGTPANLVIGMEFGAAQTGPNAWRFPPRTPKRGRGNEGYWIYKTASSRQREIIDLWFKAMDDIVRKWSD